jgi:glycosyltransferase involved in cell wall biosynthesis
MQKNKIQISIIIATNNSEKYIRRCLNSILDQKGASVELIIVDNKSTDKTVELVKNSCNLVDIFISENDSGIYDAWNKGLKVASGDWIMFMGSDDVLLHDAIDYYLSLDLRKGQYDYIAPVIDMVSEQGNLVKKFGKDFKWLEFKEAMNLAHVGALHNRKLFKDVGNYNTEFKVCGDYELLLRKGMNLKVRFIDRIVAKMQLGGISQTRAALYESRRARHMHVSPISFRSEVKFLVFLVKHYLKGFLRVKQ